MEGERTPKEAVRAKHRVPWKYDLASIMVLILILAVGLGLSLRVSTAGIGVPLLLLGPATILRSTPILIKRKREGWKGDLDSTANLYFDSFFVAVLLFVAGSIAFAIVCVPIGAFTIRLYGPSPHFWIALVGGGLAACIVLYLLGRRIFPPKD